MFYNIFLACNSFVNAKNGVDQTKLAVTMFK